MSNALWRGALAYKNHRVYMNRSYLQLLLTSFNRLIFERIIPKLVYNEATTSNSCEDSTNKLKDIPQHIRMQICNYIIL